MSRQFRFPSLRSAPKMVVLWLVVAASGCQSGGNETRSDGNLGGQPAESGRDFLDRDPRVTDLEAEIAQLRTDKLLLQDRVIELENSLEQQAKALGDRNTELATAKLRLDLAEKSATLESEARLRLEEERESSREALRLAAREQERRDLEIELAAQERAAQLELQAEITGQAFQALAAQRQAELNQARSALEAEEAQRRLDNQAAQQALIDRELALQASQAHQIRQAFRLNQLEGRKHTGRPNPRSNRQPQDQANSDHPTDWRIFPPQPNYRLAPRN